MQVSVAQCDERSTRDHKDTGSLLHLVISMRSQVHNIQNGAPKKLLIEMIIFVVAIRKKSTDRILLKLL